MSNVEEPLSKDLRVRASMQSHVFLEVKDMDVIPEVRALQS